MIYEKSPFANRREAESSFKSLKLGICGTNPVANEIYVLSTHCEHHRHTRHESCDIGWRQTVSKVYISNKLDLSHGCACLLAPESVFVTEEINSKPVACRDKGITSNPLCLFTSFGPRERWRAWKGGMNNSSEGILSHNQFFTTTTGSRSTQCLIERPNECSLCMKISFHFAVSRASSRTESMSKSPIMRNAICRVCK